MLLGESSAATRAVCHPLPPYCPPRPERATTSDTHSLTTHQGAYPVFRTTTTCQHAVITSLRGVPGRCAACRHGRPCRRRSGSPQGSGTWARCRRSAAGRRRRSRGTSWCPRWGRPGLGVGWGARVGGLSFSWVREPSAPLEPNPGGLSPRLPPLLPSPRRHSTYGPCVCTCMEGSPTAHWTAARCREDTGAARAEKGTGEGKWLYPALCGAGEGKWLYAGTCGAGEGRPLSAASCRASARDLRRPRSCRACARTAAQLECGTRL